MKNDKKQNRSKKPNIFEYDDYRKYLRDLYAFLKATKKGFSLRTFSSEAGFASHSNLKQVMDGTRKISRPSIDKYVRALNLGQAESKFFRALVLFNQATTNEEKATHYEEMSKFRGYQGIRRIEREQFRYCSKWYHAAVRGLVVHPGFQEDPNWIARTLRPRITPWQAQKSLELLQELKMVERDAESGKLRAVDPIVSTSQEVQSVAVKKFHREIMDTAAKALDDVPSGERDFTASTLGIPKAMFPEIKKMIWDCHNKIVEKVGNAKEPVDRMYQVNIQVFPISEDLEKS